jgi:hypothetical protein
LRKTLVRAINESDETLKVLLRGGVNEIEQECNLPDCPGRVWFESDEVANVLGLVNLILHFTVTYDSNGDNCFHVWKDHNLVMTFSTVGGRTVVLRHRQANSILLSYHNRGQ